MSGFRSGLRSDYGILRAARSLFRSGDGDRALVRRQRGAKLAEARRVTGSAEAS